MDALAFEHHLTSPQGHRRLPEDGFTVAAGGGSCCDTVQLSVSIDRDRIADAGFESHGCGAATAAGSAAVTLIRGQTVLDAARVGPREIAAELGGLSPGKLHAAEVAGDALARALGAAVRARGESEPPPGGRTLVAMSGGVDSAVAGLLCARTGDTAAVTLELWADSENDAERSCCSASAVSQARAVAHSMGLAHFTIDLRDEFRAGVVEPLSLAMRRGRRRTRASAATGTSASTQCSSSPTAWVARALATGHYARTAEPDHDRGPLLRVAADPAKDQTYMLAALSPRSLSRMRFPLGELTKPEVRRIAADAGLPVAAKADSQDLCFLAGTDRGRFLERHGEVGDRVGPIVDRDGAVLGRHRGQHRFTVGQRRGVGYAGGEPLYVLEKHAGSNTIVVGPSEALRSCEVPLRGARLRREPARVDRVKLRYRSTPIPARIREAPGDARSLTVELGEPADTVAPGQIACLMDGEIVIGWGTIARPGA